MSKTWKKLLSVILTLTMVISMLPMSVLALSWDDLQDAVENGGEIILDGDITEDASHPVRLVPAGGGSQTYATLAEAVAAADDGDTIQLKNDVELTGTTLNLTKSITIEGNDHAITQAEGFAANGSNAMLDIMGGATVTFENVVFDGIKGCAVMRTANANVVMDGCVVRNCEHTASQGLLRLALGNATITDSKFLNNDCTMVISFGYDAANDTDVLTVDNCEFEGNTCGETAVVYFAGGDKATVTKTQFVDNAVSSTGNAATVYLGFNDNCEVSGCLFNGNKVSTTSTTSERVASAIFGDGCVVKNNAFVANTATGGVDPKTVTVGGYYNAADVSGNYWDGEEPDYKAEYDSKATVNDSYYINYSTDSNGNVVLDEEDKVEIAPTTYVAEVNGVKYATLAEAFAAAKDGDTVKLLSDLTTSETYTVAAGKTVTLDLNGKTISGTDNATGSFGLITNRGTLTIKDSSSAKTGKITLTATNDRDWNAYSSVISNTVGGKLTVESGTIEHLGGSDMAYGIDNLTNGKGTYAETVINGGTVKSPYRAIRQFLNGTEAQNILTITGGTIEGANKSVWMQDPSANANSGTLTVGEDAELKGDVYLSVTAGSTEWPVQVAIAAAALTGESKVATSNVPAGYEVKESNGTYGVQQKTGLSGSGTEAEPYLINNLDDLLWFQAKVDEQATDGSTQFAGKYFKLTADIDLAGINWNPIGSMSGDHGAFKGVFDGGDHTISNLNVQQAGNGLGLFARTAGNAVIKNLKLNNVTVKSTDNSNYVGGLIGNSYASTKIENVHVTGNIDISGRGYIGGISGHGYVVMDNVSVKGTGTISSTFWCAGGILGYGGEGATNIKNAHVEGVTITSAAGGLGAIVGMAEDNNGTQPISGSNLSAKDVEIKTYVGAYGTAYEDYAMGYLYGGNPTSKLTGNLTVEDVVVETASGNSASINDAVATVDGAIYFDLQAAVNAGGTVKVLRDLTLTDTVTVPAGKTVTLDLAGKTVTYNSTVQGEAMITNHGNLTINDTVGGGEIYYNYTGAADSTYSKGNYTISNGGTLTVNGGKIHIANLGGHAKYPIDNNSTSGDAILVITGGHLYNYNTSAIRQFCNSTTNVNSVTINGGVIEGYCAIWVQNPGKNTVNGQLSITGGEIKSTAKAYVNGTAELKDVGSRIYFTIDGEGGAWSESSSVSITGGTFNENVNLAENAPAAITVDESEATFNGRLELPKVYIAEVDGVGYETLQAAIDAADGKTVTLLADMTIESDFSSAAKGLFNIADGKKVTIDLNNKTINATENSTGNFILFYSYGELTIKNGTVNLTATVDRDWNAESAIILNRGGVLNIESGTYTHNGGTDMAFVVDNSGNYYGDATANIIGGTLTSSYIAIRNRMEQNTHGASGKAILNVAGGTISGTSRAIWAQAASTSTTAPATGAINVSGGDVGLIDTARSAGAESMTTITGGTVEAVKCEVGELTITGGIVGEKTILTAGGEAADFVVTDAGLYAQAVAKVGETKYATLQAAIDAAKIGDTITLTRDVKEVLLIPAPAATASTETVSGTVTIDLNGKTLDGSILAPAAMLTVKNGSIKNTDSSVSAIEINAGTLNLENVNIESARHAVRIDGAVGAVINGGEYTVKAPSGTRHAVNVSGAADVTIKGGEFVGPAGTVMDSGSAVCVQAGAKVTIEDGSFYGGKNATLGVSGTMIVKGGTFDQNPSAYLASGYAALPDLNGNFVVGVKPTATVNNLGGTVIPAGSYGVWNGSSYDDTSTDDMPLSFVMQFKADQTAADMAASPYADWYGDFVITFTGIENGSFIADGCYLAGHYGEFGWVKVPVDGMSIENGVRYPVMLGVNLGQKYDYICSGVQDFKCALYLTPEVLEANPNLEVKLELGVVDNSKGSSAAADALASADASKRYTVTEYSYDVEDLAADFAAKIGSTPYKTLADAVAAAQNTDTIVLLKNVALAETLNIPAGKNVTIDLAGKTVSGTCNAGQAHLIMVAYGADLTIKDSSAEQTGKVTYAAGTSNVGWTIDVEGDLVLESGTIELTGDWSIGYAVDLRPNAWGTAYTEPTTFTMNGGNVISSDGAVRVASSSADTYSEVAAVFTMNGGKIVAAWDGVFVQQSNAAWDTLSVTVNGGTIESGLNPIRLYGPTATSFVKDEGCMDIVLNGGTLTYTGTETREWLVEGIIRTGGGATASDFVKDADVVASASFAASNVADGLKWVAGTDGKYTLQAANYVAEVNGVKFETLAAALAAAQDGETVTLIWSEGKAPIAMNGSVYGKTVTITGTATVDWSKGFLFVGRGGAGNGTVIFDNANLTSASDSASTGIHVSGREKDTNNKYDGTLIIKNSTIELDYLIDRGTIELDNSNLTVKNGFGIAGRPASETETAEPATATITVKNGSYLKVLNHNGMGVGQAASVLEGYGILNLEAGSTFETTQSFNVSANGTMNLAGTAKIAGTLTNNGSIVLTDAAATLTSTECGNVTTNVAGHKVAYENGAYKLTAATYVAEVNGVKFETLQDAENAAADGDTIVLLDNIELTEKVTFYNAAGARMVTLDMKGKTITLKDGYTDYCAFWVCDGLTITGNGEITADPDGEDSWAYVGIVGQRKSGTTEGTYVGELVIENGTFYSDDASVVSVTNGSVTINGGSFEAAGKEFTLNCIDDMYKAGKATITVKGGTYAGFNPEANAAEGQGTKFTAEGYGALPDLNGNFVVGVKPTATVNNLGMMTIPAGGWKDLNFTVGTEDMPLSFVMQFLADQDEEDMATSPYADWYGDFVITFTGLENGSFDTAGCYLAGHYGEFGWIKVPIEGILATVNEGDRYPVMLGVGMGQKYDYICSGVEDFKCAMYLTPEVLEANPNLKVKLELSVVDNSKGEDAAANALVNNENIYEVNKHEYVADDFVINYVAEVGGVKYTDLQDAIDAATAGQTVKLLDDIVLTAGVTVAADDEIVLELNGKTIGCSIEENLAASFALIKNRGTLTVQDSVGDGKISLNYGGASFGYGIGLYTISNEGGTLNVTGGTVENLATVSGSMYDAIDNNSTLGDTVLNITGGTVSCSYIAVRQFANSTTHKNDVNITGGTVAGGNSSVWMQNPNSNANKASVSVTDGATIKGRILAGASEEFTYSITGGLFDEAAKNGTVPELLGNYEFTGTPNADGFYTVEEKAAEDFTDEDLKFNNSLNFASYIGIQFVVDKTAAAKYDSVYVVVEHETPDGNRETTVTENIGASIGYYVYEYATVAKEIGDELTITVYGVDADDNIYTGETKVVSIKDLALNALSTYYGKGNLKACTLLVDMLNYGAEAQKTFNYKADSLANAGLDEIYANLATQSVEISKVNSTDGAGTVNAVQQSLGISSMVQLQFIFAGDMSAYEAHVTVDGVTTVIDGADFDVLGSYSVLVIDVAAKNMSADHIITIWDKSENKQVSVTYTSSVEGGAKSLLNNGTYADFAVAMMKYGAAAEEYFK